MKPKQYDYVKVIINVPKGAEGDKAFEAIANELLMRKLCACVHKTEISSVYLWDGKMNFRKELRLEARTTNDKMPLTVGVVKKHHPDKVPSIIFEYFEPEYAYGAWVVETTRHGE